MNDRRTPANDIRDAYELMAWFSHRGIEPADSLLVVAAMNAALFIQARRDGKDVTTKDYTTYYGDALELYAGLLGGDAPAIQALAARLRKDQTNDPTK